MGKISVKKVISDVRDAYVELTGDTDEITYGNISTKISEIETGGGVEGGYVVKFKVDDEDYYVASCQQGEDITAPPTPTGTGTFTAWQLNGVDVSFPYTPSADVELTANFATVRTEMEVYAAGTVLRTSRNKANNGTAVGGRTNFWYTDGYVDRVMLVAKENSSAEITGNATGSGTITYNGETWYWWVAYQGSVNTAIYDMGNDRYTQSTYTNEVFAKDLLDHYFRND